MKIKVKNYHIIGLLNLLSELQSQRMLIGDKVKIKENFDKLLKKNSTLEELRIDIIISNGGTKEEGIKPDHENYSKVVAEINELFALPTEISLQIIPMNTLERFEVSEKIDLDSIAILAGTYVLPDVEPDKIEETENTESKSVELKPEEAQ